MIVAKCPLISVIMPVYNGDDYFEFALASVLQQTWENFEIIVVDDGSSDPRRVERLCYSSGPKVKYFYQENTGVAGALQHGIRAMQGDIFTWLSHDDLFHPNKLKRQVEYFARLNNPDAILFSDYNLIDEAGVKVGEIRAPRNELVEAPQKAILNGRVNGCTIFIPRHVLESSPGFDERWRYTQDYRLWNELLKSYDFFHQPEILVDYRIHASQGSNNPEAIAEADELWIDMASDRTEFERVSMYGSSYQFFSKLADHLSASPYRVAEKWLRDRAATAVQESMLTTIFVDPVTTEQVIAFAETQMTPRHVRTEYLWRDQPNLPIWRLPPGKSGPINTMVKSVTKADFLNDCVRLSYGDYVTFAGPMTPKSAAEKVAGLVMLHHLGNTVGLTNLAAGTPIEPRDLLIFDSSPPFYALHNWIFHRIELTRGPAFRHDLIETGECGMLALLVAGSKPVGLFERSLVASVS